MFNLLTQFNHKAEIRESKDEIFVGELVRAMSRSGFTAIGFSANDDCQLVKFRALRDPVIRNFYVRLDRKTGSGMISAAIIGSKATITVTGEVKNYLSDPDDLVAMFKTDLANIFKLPVLGGIRLNHEMNSIFATSAWLIDIDDFVLKGEAGNQQLAGFITQKMSDLREKLAPYKKATR